MRPHIVEKLQRVERECGVRILLAVESGSRAWGFASPDSDYDVRFIYAPPLDWYLTIEDRRDVIDRMLPGDLDLSGWELRKALRLFARCNLALNEWILSPEVYLSTPEFAKSLTDLMPRYFNAIAGLHHYRRMAETSLDDNYRDGHIGIKKIFYVLRPLFACRWIEHCRSQPPTEFARLVDCDWVSSAEKEWVRDLLAVKSTAAEKMPLALESSRADALRMELAHYSVVAANLSGPEKRDPTDLDAILKREIRHT